MRGGGCGLDDNGVGHRRVAHPWPPADGQRLPTRHLLLPTHHRCWEFVGGGRPWLLLPLQLHHHLVHLLLDLRHVLLVAVLLLLLLLQALALLLQLLLYSQGAARLAKCLRLLWL